jgi:Ca-activated chloride channel family protein
VIQLAWPWVLLALPLPWLAWRLLPPAESGGGPALRVPFFRRLAALAGGPGGAGRASRLRLAGAVAAWLLLVLAAARPQWVGEPLELPVTGRDVLMAVDVSRSMENVDLAPGGTRATRLQVVQALGGGFIRGRVGDRIGLVLFGSRAYLQSPLTFDREAVARRLAEAVTGLAGRRTAIGDAVGLAIRHLRAREVEERVLVLLSDGANTAGAVDPREAARMAARAGLRIHTIGVGGDGAGVEGPFGLRLRSGSDLDEALLRELAETTGGRYFRARDAEALARVYRELDRLEPVAGPGRVVRPRRALFPWPLAGALGLSAALVAVPLLSRLRRPGAGEAPA